MLKEQEIVEDLGCCSLSQGGGRSFELMTASSMFELFMRPSTGNLLFKEGAPDTAEILPTRDPKGVQKIPLVV